MTEALNQSAEQPDQALLSTSLSVDEIGQLAIEFLITDLELTSDDQDWFSVLAVRPIGETWHVAELGVEGLPDKWIVQVYDTGECDPCYTFTSPVQASEADTGLEDMPEAIAKVLMIERGSH